MISSSIGFGHPGKYSFGNPHEYLSGWRKLSRIWDFFSNSDFSSPICCDFFRTVLFLEKLLLQNFSEYLLRHNSYFFRAANSSEELIFLRISFFKTVTFFEVVIFSSWLLYQSETSTEQPLFENKKIFRGFTFWSSCLFGRELFRIKTSTA